MNNTCNNKTNRTVSLLLYLALFIFTIVLYSKTVSYNLSGIDDDIFSEYSFKDYSLKDIFTTNVYLKENFKSDYRPLLTLSFFVDNLIYKSPCTMHTTNILLHAICAMLFMLFLRYYFDTKISFFLSLLFAAHPICLFTAAWIPGRNDSLLCIFFLLSVIFFTEYLKQDKKLFLFFNLIFFICSLLTKETSIFFPVVYITFWFVCNKKINKTFIVTISLYSLILFSFLIAYPVGPFSVIKSFPHWITDFKQIFDYFAAICLFNVHFSTYFHAGTIILGIISVLIYFLFSCFSDLTKKEKILFFILPIILIGITLIRPRLFFQGNKAYLALLFMLIPFYSFITKYFGKKLCYVILIILIVLSVNITVKKQHAFTNDLSFFETIDKEKENYDVYLAIDYACFLLRDGYWQKASVKAKEIEQILKKENKEDILNTYVLAVVCMYKENFEQAINMFEKILLFNKDEFNALQSVFEISTNDIYAKLILCCEKINDDEKRAFYHNMLLNK